ncbi:MAG TPA: phosphoribosyltransferase [Chitinophagaceae bacterium]|nr:phosphoribosyltransferase [Chitinophagaceae bacterium]
MNSSKSWDEISSKIKGVVFNESFDMIIAIANGGVVPAALLNQRLQLPIELLKINYRDAKQQPLYPSPKLLSDLNFDVKNKRVLLVEDRVKTGATVNYAKSLLRGAALVKTFAVNGKADYALYDEACFSFPWII